MIKELLYSREFVITFVFGMLSLHLFIAILGWVAGTVYITDVANFLGLEMNNLTRFQWTLFVHVPTILIAIIVGLVSGLSLGVLLRHHHLFFWLLSVFICTVSPFVLSLFFVDDSFDLLEDALMLYIYSDFWLSLLCSGFFIFLGKKIRFRKICA